MAGMEVGRPTRKLSWNPVWAGVTTQSLLSLTNTLQDTPWRFTNQLYERPLGRRVTTEGLSGATTIGRPGRGRFTAPLSGGSKGLAVDSLGARSGQWPGSGPGPGVFYCGHTWANRATWRRPLSPRCHLAAEIMLI